MEGLDGEQATARPAGSHRSWRRPARSSTWREGHSIVHVGKRQLAADRSEVKCLVEVADLSEEPLAVRLARVPFHPAAILGDQHVFLQRFQPAVVSRLLTAII